MSRPDTGAESVSAFTSTTACLEPYPSRTLTLGALEIARALPVRGRRLVGPWCFLDRFGPLTFVDGNPMDVAPHPHMGLQTVTWLLDGEIVHDDSLRAHARLQPGGVNVMTSGDAIAHAERTPRDHSGRLDGVQLWTALPEADRRGAPSFQHVAEVPVVEAPGGLVRVFSGALAGATSPARRFSELVGADLQVHRGEALSLDLDPRFEHAVLRLGGDAAIDGQPLDDRVLYYLGASRADVTVGSREGCRLLLVGGPPFPETILMWWNFVARTPEEIRDARADWVARRRFGDVPAYDGPRLAAPDLVRLAHPNPVS
jgi:hypothetical protein